MAKQIMSLIYIFNFILLIGLVAGIMWWQQKYGRLTANKFAALLTGYFSFSFITTLSPFLITNTSVTTIVDIVFVLILWCIGFPWFRWIYSKFSSSK